MRWETKTEPLITVIHINRYSALLFDLDGTLVDTLPLHYRAYAEVFAERSLDLHWETFFAQLGPPASIAIPRLHRAAGGGEIDAQEVATIHEAKKKAFRRLLQCDHPVILPAARWLQRARRMKLCGLVTSGNRNGVEAILDRLEWRDWFATIVTGDDVQHGKPSPDPFVLAAERLKVRPGDCLAFEDTADGLRSARDAGMAVVDVSLWGRP